MTARRRLARARLRFQLARARQLTWYRGLTGLGRAGVALAIGVVFAAVLMPFVGPGDAMWVGLGNAILVETVFAFGERYVEPARA